MFEVAIALKLIRVKPLKSGMVNLTYSTWS